MYLLPPRIKSRSRAISPAAGHALSEDGSQHGSSYTCILLAYIHSVGSRMKGHKASHKALSGQIDLNRAAAVKHEKFSIKNSKTV